MERPPRRREPSGAELSLQASVAARQDSVAERDNALDVATKRIDMLVTENNSLVTAVDAMEARLTKEQAAVAAAKRDGDDYRRECTKLERRVGTLERDIEQLRGTQYSSDSTTVQNMQLLKLLKQAEARSSELSEENRELRAETDDMRERLDHALARMAEREADIASMKGAVAVAERGRSDAESAAALATEVARNAQAPVTRPGAGDGRDVAASEELRIRRERHYAMLSRLQQAQDSERRAIDRAENAEDMTRKARQQMLQAEQRLLQITGSFESKIAELESSLESQAKAEARAAHRATVAEAEVRMLRSTAKQAGMTAAKLATTGVQAEQQLVHAHDEIRRLEHRVEELVSAQLAEQVRTKAAKAEAHVLADEIRRMHLEMDRIAKRAAEAEAFAKASRDGATAAFADEPSVVAHMQAKSQQPSESAGPPLLGAVAGSGKSILAGSVGLSGALQSAQRAREQFSLRALLLRMIASIVAPAIALPVASAQNPPSHVLTPVPWEEGRPSADLCSLLFGVRAGPGIVQTGRVPLLDLSGLALGDAGVARVVAALSELPLPLTDKSQSVSSVLLGGHDAARGWAPRCIDLRGNGLTDQGARAIAQLIDTEGSAVGTSKRIRMHAASGVRLWDLRGNHITMMGVKALVGALNGRPGRALGVEHSMVDDAGLIRGLALSGGSSLCVAIDCRMQLSPVDVLRDLGEAAAGPELDGELLPLASSRRAGSLDGEPGERRGIGSSHQDDGVPFARWLVVEQPPPPPDTAPTSPKALPQVAATPPPPTDLETGDSVVSLPVLSPAGLSSVRHMPSLASPPRSGRGSPRVHEGEEAPGKEEDGAIESEAKAAVVHDEEAEDHTPAAALAAASRAISAADKRRSDELRQEREAARIRAIRAMTGVAGLEHGPYGGTQVHYDLAADIASAESRALEEREHKPAPHRQRGASRKMSSPLAVGSGRSAARARRRK
jgi:hypothetical protein